TPDARGINNTSEINRTNIGCLRSSHQLSYLRQFSSLRNLTFAFDFITLDGQSSFYPILLAFGIFSNIFIASLSKLARCLFSRVRVRPIAVKHNFRVPVAQPLERKP